METLTRGSWLRMLNEPFKLGVCRDCGKYPKRVRKETNLCERCMIPYAPIVEGLLLGWQPIRAKNDSQVADKSEQHTVSRRGENPMSEAESDWTDSPLSTN